MPRQPPPPRPQPLHQRRTTRRQIMQPAPHLHTRRPQAPQRLVLPPHQLKHLTAPQTGRTRIHRRHVEAVTGKPSRFAARSTLRHQCPPPTWCFYEHNRAVLRRARLISFGDHAHDVKCQHRCGSHQYARRSALPARRGASFASSFSAASLVAYGLFSQAIRCPPRRGVSTSITPDLAAIPATTGAIFRRISRNANSRRGETRSEGVGPGGGDVRFAPSPPCCPLSLWVVGGREAGLVTERVWFRWVVGGRGTWPVTWGGIRSRNGVGHGTGWVVTERDWSRNVAGHAKATHPSGVGGCGW
jgi:hypothetical protein